MEMPHLFADVRLLGDINTIFLQLLQSLNWE